MVELVFQLLANTVPKWGLYGLLACGFGLLYRSLRVFQMAFAGVVIIAPYGALLLTRSLGLSLPLALALGAAIAAMAGGALEGAVFRPLAERASNETSMIASLGVLVVIQNLLGVAFGQALQNFDRGVAARIEVGPVAMTSIQLIQVAISVVIIAVFFVVMKHSASMLQIRAMGDQSRLLTYQGAHVARLRLIVWLTAGTLGGVGGVLYAFDLGIDPRVGMQLFLGAAVAVFLGGRDRAAGWIAGAFCVALFENVVTLWLDARWGPTFMYACALGLLLVRSRGLLVLKTRAGEEGVT
jgi:branched-chain amino acid transport system permease protein